jgi:predicted phage baseplate assembly protein
MLQPADVPIDDPVCGAEIELEGEVDGLEPGRWLIITGNRAVTSSPNLGDAAAGDSFSVPDVPVSELVMLLSVRQDTLYIDDTGTIVSPSAVGGTDQLIPLPGDSIHTFLTLSAPLSYCYQRDTVQIYANVAHATHGQTWREVLGSGNAAADFQRFTLKNAPLTYTAADNPSGVQSSLNVYVNEVRWHEVDNLLDMGPADHDYLTDADAEEKTGVTAGDGRNGARLPTGTENVRAVYRSGIGIPGNVQAGQISLLVSGTDGLKSVINPQPATGGADPEGLESTRARIPLAVSALDRLVATADYAEFARLFAGIGKAASVRLPSSHGQMVQVTIAGQDDIPIDESSDLFRNLLAALEDYGDPYLPVSLARRELLLLVIAARVKLNSDYVWETVEPQIRAGLAGVFGFDARDLAQSAYAAEAMAAMASVPGVEYAALDLFAAVSEDTPPSQLASLGTTLSGVADRIAAAPGRIDPVTRTAKPAQLLILDPAIPTTLLLTEVPQ